MYASARVCAYVCVCVHDVWMCTRVFIVCVCVVHCVAVCIGPRNTMLKFRISSTRCCGYSFFFLLLIFVQLLFEGGVYLFGKLVGINHNWIRTIQWQLLDAVSSKCSLLVLLSAVETSHTYNTSSPNSSLLTIIHVDLLHTSCSYYSRCLSCSELPTV